MATLGKGTDTQAKLLFFVKLIHKRDKKGWPFGKYFISLSPNWVKMPFR